MLVQPQPPLPALSGNPNPQIPHLMPDSLKAKPSTCGFIHINCGSPSSPRPHLNPIPQHSRVTLE